MGNKVHDLLPSRRLSLDVTRVRGVAFINFTVRLLLEIVTRRILQVAQAPAHALYE
jgi:hypothetical protein